MIKNTLLLLLVTFSITLPAQTFVDIQAKLTGVSESASNWIDFDQDGNLDVFVTGDFYNKAGHYLRTKMYRNLKHNHFSRVYTPLPNVTRGDFDWADYDLDGDPDLFMTGQDESGKFVARLFKNNKRTTQFIPVFTKIPGMVDGSVEWGDYDGDGDPDLLLTGETTKGPVTRIYRNDRHNVFTNIKAPFPGVHFGVARFDDFDQDGDLDVIVSGATSSGLVVTQLFMFNNGQYEKLPTDVIHLRLCDIAWGDFDMDGDDDFVIIGETQNGKYQTKLYRNEKNGFFSLTPVQFANVRSGSVDWGDFDHDGDLDLLLTGESVSGPVSIIYRNDRNDRFTNINAQLIPLYMSDGHFGDYDNDGDLDVVISGMSSQYHFITKIYRNDPMHTDTVKSGPTEEDIFNYRTTVPEMPKKIYFYVYASCWCDLNGSGKKRYHLFISPVKKPKAQYDLEDSFNRLIRKKYPNWDQFDQADLIQNGFSVYSKGVASRKSTIYQYKIKNFIIHKLNW